MKTYEPRRNNECPNGIHAAYEPAKDPTQNECTCPWLIIASSTPVQHLTSWSRRELENVIKETDRGYFDPPGYPLRSNSMFLSPNMQRLVDMAEKEPVAAALTLLAGAAAHGDSGLPPFDAIAWDAEDGCLSLRVPGLGWRRLWLGHANVDALTDSDFTTAGGANPVLLWADHPDTAADVDLPEGLVTTPHEPAQDYYADDFGARPEPLVIGEDGSIPGFDSGYTGPPLESIPLPQMVSLPTDIAALGPGNPIYDAEVLGRVDQRSPDITDEEEELVRRYWPGLPYELLNRARVALAQQRVAEEEETARHLAAVAPLTENAQWVQVDRMLTLGSIHESALAGTEPPLPRRVPQVPSAIAQASDSIDPANSNTIEENE